MKGLEEEFIDFMEHVGNIVGYDNSFSEIMGILYLEPEAIPLENLVDKTGYCLSSISQKISMLELMGFIKKSRKPDCKKVYVFMPKKSIPDIRKRWIEKPLAKINLTKKILPSIIKKYKPLAKTEKDIKKIRIIEDMYDRNTKCEKMVYELQKILDKEGIE